jgi:hypothetical protein
MSSVGCVQVLLLRVKKEGVVVVPVWEAWKPSITMVVL